MTRQQGNRSKGNWQRTPNTKTVPWNELEAGPLPPRSSSQVPFGWLQAAPQLASRIDDSFFSSDMVDPASYWAVTCDSQFAQKAQIHRSKLQATGAMYLQSREDGMKHSATATRHEERSDKEVHLSVDEINAHALYEDVFVQKGTRCMGAPVFTGSSGLSGLAPPASLVPQPRLSHR
eukprot:CAMPEP_0169305648 /NCGR_PEP_ID=MMETSP1017-20121227/257_1 /TAXON_ID=342587 /ORGANISM="Karlodinium micrum, Strain CCMP2283" /LENGTH=176 /DNA_ID=CAMNT_0009398655 /DNA_START=29 /DNA_END=559 /DNA_ORIENTATION=-